MSDNTRQDSEYSDYIEDSSREDFCDSERALRAAEEGAPRQFRKKPVVIEAVQWDGDKATANEFIGTDYGNDWFYYDGNSGNNRRIVIPTLEGNHVGEIGDWIIKGVKGEFYPCKSDIFAMTYEIVSPEAAPAVFHKAIACPLCSCSQTLPADLQVCSCACHHRDRSYPAPAPAPECPVTPQELRVLSDWMKAVSGVVVLPSFDEYHSSGTIDRVRALADWMEKR